MNLKSFLILLILYASIPVFGQQHIDCGGVQLTVPTFKEDTVALPLMGNLENILVYKNILKQISKSDKAFELRFYTEHYGRILLYVIKCAENKITAERYSVYGSKIGPDLSGTAYHDLGGLDNSNINFIYKKVPYTIPLGISWQQFLSSILVENHLFELPDQADLDTVKSLKIRPVDFPHPNGTRFEITINGHFRSFEEYKVSAYMENDLPAIKYYKNIYALLLKLIPENEKVN